MSDVKTSKTKTKNVGLFHKLMSADLRAWNKYVALLHAVQGIVILILSATRSFPVTTSFLGVDSLQTQAQGHTVLATGSQHLFDVNLAYLIAAAFFLAAIAHGLIATKLWALYERDIKKNSNRIRWIEYALSAGVMMVSIGLLVGVQDISVLLMLFGVPVITNLLGWIMEAQNQGARKTNWLSYSVGCIAGVLPWIILAIYLIGGGLYGATAAAYVYWIFGTMLVLFGAFAGNMYLYYRKPGNWKAYAYSERVFMILSLAAKTALAWQVFAGSLHP